MVMTMVTSPLGWSVNLPGGHGGHDQRFAVQGPLPWVDGPGGATGEVLVITKNGQPVAELHACAPARRASPFGLHPGVEIHGDLLAPIDSPWAVLE